MSIARRAILKIIGAAPAALPMASSVAPGLFAAAEPLAAAGMILGAPAPPTHVAPGERTGVGKLLGDQLNDLRSQFDAEEYWSQSLRVNGVDHDLAALKSVAHQHKAVRMIERQRAQFSLSRRVSKLLWG